MWNKLDDEICLLEHIAEFIGLNLQAYIVDDNDIDITVDYQKLRKDYVSDKDIVMLGAYVALTNFKKKLQKNGLEIVLKK